MRLRPLGIALGFLLIPAAAHADGHRAGFFAGASFMKASSLSGVHVSGEYVPFHRNLILIADYSIHNGDHEGADLTLKSGLAGGGVRFAIGPNLALGGHILGGGVSGEEGNGTAAFGALIEILPYRTTPGWHPGFRFQYDYLNRKGDANFHRFSVGVVFRFVEN